MARHHHNSPVSKSNWQPGDMALAIGGGQYLKGGRIYVVEAVTGPHLWQDDDLGLGLIVAGVKLPANDRWGGMFYAGHFVKVTPTEPDAFDREVIARLKRLTTEA